MTQLSRFTHNLRFLRVWAFQLKNHGRLLVISLEVTQTDCVGIDLFLCLISCSVFSSKLALRTIHLDINLGHRYTHEPAHRNMSIFLPLFPPPLHPATHQRGYRETVETSLGNWGKVKRTSLESFSCQLCTR